MDAEPRRIEIFAPFGAALDLTKRILFQPFDLGKWCLIGFAAFLAQLGGGFRFNFPSNLGKGDWNFHSTTHDALGSTEGWPGWLIPLVGVIVLFVIAFVVVLMWVGARGRFIFTDCVVRNRGAIVEPWKDFKREGNSLFFFRLTMMCAFLFLFVVAAVPLWWPLVTQHSTAEGAGLVAGIVLVSGAVLVVVAVLALLFFMVPIMYRRRCGAVQAMRESAGLVMGRPGVVILFFLFNLVLALAIVFATCALTCATCCITAIPYVGTVILLPIYVFWMSYLLLFLRQFGPEYDVWAGLVPDAPVAPPAKEPPPPTDPPALV